MLLNKKTKPQPTPHKYPTLQALHKSKEDGETIADRSVRLELKWVVYGNSLTTVGVINRILS